MSAESLLGHALDHLEGGPVHCEGAIARDHEGRKVTADSPYAVAWDVHGLLLRAARVGRFPYLGDVVLAADALHEAARDLGFRTARELSDQRGRDGTIALYRRAITHHSNKGRNGS